MVILLIVIVSLKFITQIQVLPATTFCLGCWQVRRLQWKENLLRDLHSRMLLEAVPLPENKYVFLHSIAKLSLHSEHCLAYTIAEIQA